MRCLRAVGVRRTTCSLLWLRGWSCCAVPWGIVARRAAEVGFRTRRHPTSRPHEHLRAQVRCRGCSGAWDIAPPSVKNLHACIMLSPRGLGRRGRRRRRRRRRRSVRRQRRYLAVPPQAWIVLNPSRPLHIHSFGRWRSSATSWPGFAARSTRLPSAARAVRLGRPFVPLVLGPALRVL